VWQLLGRIVNDNAVDYISSKINRLQTSQADLVWGILQKLAANEEVCVGSKDTTTGTAHCWNPFFVKEPKKKGYANLSNALPISKLFYPPWMEPPAQGSASKHKPKKRDWKTREPVGLNPLAIASTIAKHPNDSPPHTPERRKKEQFYGFNLNPAGAPGGPNTTYTNMDRNPYWEPGRPDPPQATKQQRKSAVRPQSRPQSARATTGRKAPTSFTVAKKKDTYKSSVPLDHGLAMPVSEYSGVYTNHGAARAAGCTNQHHMPTACITGMGMAGAGLNPSGAPAVGAGTNSKSASHAEFLKRISLSRDSGRSKKRPQTAGSRYSSRPQTHG